MEARLPQHELTKLKSLLDFHSRKRKITLKDLKSLIGLLNFCCLVVVPGRSFFTPFDRFDYEGDKAPASHYTLKR